MKQNGLFRHHMSDNLSDTRPVAKTRLAKPTNEPEKGVQFEHGDRTKSDRGIEEQKEQNEDPRLTTFTIGLAHSVTGSCSVFHPERREFCSPKPKQLQGHPGLSLQHVDKSFEGSSSLLGIFVLQRAIYRSITYGAHILPARDSWWCAVGQLGQGARPWPAWFRSGLPSLPRSNGLEQSTPMVPLSRREKLSQASISSQLYLISLDPVLF